MTVPSLFRRTLLQAALGASVGAVLPARAETEAAGATARAARDAALTAQPLAREPITVHEH